MFWLEGSGFIEDFKFLPPKVSGPEHPIKDP